MTSDQAFKQYLNGFRAGMLRKIPRSDAVLSFCGKNTHQIQWLERAIDFYGRHIVVEYCNPKPQELPGNVEWIVNSSDNMPEVDNNSCDLLFCGDAFEQLWLDQVEGFLTEAWRVLQPEGRLILEGPNRPVIAEQWWTLPQYMLELTVEEAKSLLTVAGFEVVLCKGLWLSRDHNGVPILPMPENEASAAERLIGGVDAPDSSLIWWIEAVRASRAPNVSQMRTLLSEISNTAWPERLSRFSSNVGIKTKDGAIVTKYGQSGFVLFGPYVALHAGRYRAEMDIDVLGSGVIAIADIATHLGVIDTQEIHFSKRVRFDFMLPETTLGFEFRVQATGSGSVCVNSKLSLVAI